MTKPVAIAIIGCGDVAMERHFPAVVASDDVVLVATCDTDIGRAERARDQFGATYAIADPAQILADPSIDAVIIATPPWVTPTLTIQAIEEGKDVLAEKPMAMTREEARRVVEAEAGSDRFVQIGFVMRHGPMFGALRKWIAEDRLGSPVSVRVGVFDELHDPAGDPEHYQRIMSTLEHGAPCIHDGAHTMDHLHFVLGERATRIASWGQTTRSEFPAPNYNAALIEFAGGHRARVEIGWFMPAFPRGEWNIIGPRGVASFLQDEGRVVLTTDDGTESVSLDGDDWFVSCFRHQLASFVDGVRTRKPTGPLARDGYASLCLCQEFEAGMSRSCELRDVSYE
jgi:predicted dehydrogenase